MSHRWPGPYRKGKVHVQSRMCGSCIFRKDSFIAKERVEQLVAAATVAQSCIPCHETSPEWTGERRNMQAVCRGFFDRHPTGPLQVAEQLGYVKFV